MAKAKTQYVCSECGDSFPQWFGKCPSCGAFNTLKAFREAKVNTSTGKKLSAGVDLIDQKQDKKSSNLKRIKTNIDEINRVLGGGFFPGSVTLFGGHPGIGKSTLALQTFLQLENAFYFSGEESQDQVLSRAQRIDPQAKELKVFSTNALEDIITTVQTHNPAFVVIDSIQMVGLQETNFGSVSQIRENAEVLIKLAKSTGTTILLIGHVTKNDELAGPKILEHLVDVVLYLEGERTSDLRILRTTKNRFGSTLEVGVFEMRSEGLSELKNPSEFFLAERAQEAFGSVITVVRDGARNFLLELQVLTVKTNFGQPRRTARGVDLNKFHLLLAVISKLTPFPCENFDAYLNIIGGLRIQDPASDLAVIAAVLSSRAEKEISASTVVFGEVGLSGEVRHVPGIDSRITECAKLGFKTVICPKLPKGFKAPNDVKIIEVKHIGECLKYLLKDA